MREMAFRHVLAPPVPVELPAGAAGLAGFYQRFGSVLLYHHEASGDAALDPYCRAFAADPAPVRPFGPTARALFEGTGGPYWFLFRLTELKDHLARGERAEAARIGEDLRAAFAAEPDAMTALDDAMRARGPNP